jgi:hypothetical protein
MKSALCAVADPSFSFSSNLRHVPAQVLLVCHPNE